MSEKTTIAIDLKVQKELNKLRKGRETYNDVVQRLIYGVSDVYVEFVLVDNELPQSHTVVFQLGEDTKSLYYWDGQNVQPITVKEAQKLLKQPKPNMTVTKEEAQILSCYIAPLSELPNMPIPENHIPTLERLKKFLEGHESNE